MEPLFTIHTLATTFSVQPAGIRKWMREGLPYFKLGRLVRFREKEVNAWLETRRARPPKQRVEYAQKLPKPALKNP